MCVSIRIYTQYTYICTKMSISNQMYKCIWIAKRIHVNGLHVTALACIDKMRTVIYAHTHTHTHIYSHTLSLTHTNTQG